MLSLIKAGSAGKPGSLVPSSCWSTSSLKEMPVTVPNKFDGNQVMFPAFLGQCQLFISLRAEDFPTDWDKVGFMIGLLSGSAACWATPLLIQASPFLDDFRGFFPGYFTF
uniref:DUF4939 domain-containing protein n=1 Tax=Laticauda laticaudata TaxID=8630 RepID=A0A8C5WSW0_LATLA